MTTGEDLAAALAVSSRRPGSRVEHRAGIG